MVYLFWDSMWHSFWHILWHSIWHALWHLFWHTFWHIFWHSFWHSIRHLVWHLFRHSFWAFFKSFSSIYPDVLSIWHLFWHFFWHSIWHSLWRLAEFQQWSSQLRSGNAHWDLALAVEGGARGTRRREGRALTWQVGNSLHMMGFHSYVSLQEGTLRTVDFRGK